MAKPLIYKTVTFEFAAHHRLISNTLNHDENFKIFSKCMGNFGHGHNYKLKVTFRYSYDQEDPFLVSRLSEQIKEIIIDPCHYQSLNEVFAARGIKNPVTTGEQIVHVFADWIRTETVAEFIDEMELIETRKNSFFYKFPAHHNLYRKQPTQNP